jgi:serine/threonine protein phosphatase PrpC
MKPAIIYAARSHVGRRRENNEDNLFADGVIRSLNSGNRPFSLDGVTEAPSVFAVSDGMGGEEAGETASFLTVQTLLTARDQIETAPSRQAVQAYVDRAHRAIQEAAPGRRSGATLALAVVSAEGVSCFNLGDSRIYLWRTDRLRQVTNDHTAAAERLRQGLPLSERERSDFRLTRCIGIGNSRTVEAYPAFRMNHCRLLLCSDGLTDLVDPQEIERLLRATPRVSDAADGLVQAALRHSGGDNVTVIVIQIKRRSFFHF